MANWGQMPPCWNLWQEMKTSIMSFLHGEVPFFVLFQFGNAALVFDDPVIHVISPICMFEGKFGVLLGEKNDHSYLQSTQYVSPLSP